MFIDLTGPGDTLTTLTGRTAYRSIHWQTLALIVGMLPFAVALEKAGGFAMAADALQEVIADRGPSPALAASAAFMTPVSSPVNTLVVGPGGYGFTDFVRIGVPLTLVALAISVLIVPVLLPL